MAGRQQLTVLSFYNGLGEMDMEKLFEPLIINNLQISNRFVRSATVDNEGKDGMVTESQLTRYRQLAKGEVGLIISSGLFPSLDGCGAPGQLGIHKDEMIPSLMKLSTVVHENGGKIAAQLMHPGWFGHPELNGVPVVGPSAIVNPINHFEVRALSSDEVYEYVDYFVQAGRRAIEAGFDAVQLHGAHSWLISSFLSPVTNKREDQWGGSPERRSTFLLRIYEGLRKIAGPKYPLLVKLGLMDYHPQGKSIFEGITTAQLLETAGIDAIEISEGMEEQQRHHIRLDAMKPCYLAECSQARPALRLPLILVGGLRTLSDMSKVVDDGIADAVSMCRPFIMDPFLVKKFHEKNVHRSGCISCNICAMKMRERGLCCELA